MQVKTITVNAANLAAAGREIPAAAGRKIPAAGLPAVNQEQQAGRKNVFGPECEVAISREGRSLSRQQAAARSSQPYPPQKQFHDLREALTEMYRGNGFTGEELLERVEDTYQELHRRAQGGIQFSLKEPTDEETAAMKELAQKAVKVEDTGIDPSRAQDLLQAAQAYQEGRI